MPYCEECGSSTTPNQKFCESCGHRLSKPTTQDAFSRERPAKYLPPQEGNQQTQTGYQPPQYQRQRFQEPIPQRSYFKYLGISVGLGILGILILVSGIFLVFAQNSIEFLGVFLLLGPLLLLGAAVVQYYYIYSNFDDFRKLHYKTHDHTVPPRNPQEPVLMLVLMFVFSPITYFLKYHQLREHLEKGHKQTENLPPSGLMYLIFQFGPLGLFILAFILSFIDGRFYFIIIVAILAPIISIIALLYFEYTWQEKFNTHVRAHNA